MQDNTYGKNLTPEEQKELDERIQQELRSLRTRHAAELLHVYERHAQKKQQCIEDTVAAYKPTVRDVLKSPLIPFRASLKEIIHDTLYSELLPGKTPLRKAILADAGTVVAFALFTAPHELLHAGMNVLTGVGNKEIVMNKLYGGDIYHWVSPNIESKVLFPLLGGYVVPASEGVNLINVPTFLIPYILTPFGIYLAQEGKKRKNIPCAIAGSGLIACHLGGIIGDFLGAGYTLVHNTTTFIAQTAGLTPQQYENNGLLNIGIALGGLYVGSRIMSFTYRLSKAGVNYVREKFKPKQQTASHS